jgi:hypothetical protein
LGLLGTGLQLALNYLLVNPIGKQEGIQGQQRTPLPMQDFQDFQAQLIHLRGSHFHLGSKAPIRPLHQAGYARGGRHHDDLVGGKELPHPFVADLVVNGLAICLWVLVDLVEHQQHRLARLPQGGQSLKLHPRQIPADDKQDQIRPLRHFSGQPRPLFAVYFIEAGSVDQLQTGSLPMGDLYRLHRGRGEAGSLQGCAREGGLGAGFPADVPSCRLLGTGDAMGGPRLKDWLAQQGIEQGRLASPHQTKGGNVDDLGFQLVQERLQALQLPF